MCIRDRDSTSLEGFYQFTWEETKVDPVGSYFSATDLAGAGAEKVMLGFGSAPDTIRVGQNIPGNPVGVAVPRVASVEPSKQGQFGAALRILAEGLGGTEFGLYFVNYHSRLPLIMARTGTSAGILAQGNYAATASYFLTYPEDIKLLGASFNTQLGRTGIALQGEVSHRRDLPLEVEQGRFRQDLYFRLNGVTVQVPPLRSRPRDILPMAEKILASRGGRWTRLLYTSPSPRD